MRNLFILLFFLMGCVPEARTGSTTFNPHTGVETAQSGARYFTPAPGQTITLSAAILSAGSVRRFVILTRVGLRGPNFPRLSGAWSLGRALDYTRIDSRYGSCIDGCMREEVGVIRLSEADFRAAARSGLNLQLVGPRVSYVLALPPAAFAEALARAATDG